MGLLEFLLAIILIAISTVVLVLGALYYFAPDLLLYFIDSFTPKNKAKEVAPQQEEYADQELPQNEVQEIPPKRRWR